LTQNTTKHHGAFLRCGVFKSNAGQRAMSAIQARNGANIEALPAPAAAKEEVDLVFPWGDLQALMEAATSRAFWPTAA